MSMQDFESLAEISAKITELRDNQRELYDNIIDEADSLATGIAFQIVNDDTATVSQKLAAAQILAAYSQSRSIRLLAIEIQNSHDIVDVLDRIWRTMST